MGIAINQFADGDKFAVETSNDGRDVIKDLLGKRKPSGRISAYAEVACDDTEKGLDRLRDSLEFLLEEVKRRRGELAQSGGNRGKGRGKTKTAS
jgi:hypothetical protein